MRQSGATAQHSTAKALEAPSPAYTFRNTDNYGLTSSAVSVRPWTASHQAGLR
jgi:hypothetical protein